MRVKGSERERERAGRGVGGVARRARCLKRGFRGRGKRGHGAGRVGWRVVWGTHIPTPKRSGEKWSRGRLH